VRAGEQALVPLDGEQEQADPDGDNPVGLSREDRVAGPIHDRELALREGAVEGRREWRAVPAGGFGLV